MPRVFFDFQRSKFVLTTSSDVLISTRRVAPVLLLLMLAGACATGTQKGAQSAASPPVLELRIAHRDSSRDRDRHQLGDTTYYLARPILLSDADIVSANPHIGQSGELYVDVMYTSTAADRLRSGLTPHIGGLLALLVESRLRLVVSIQGAISSGFVTINTAVTGSEAEQLAARVRARWPRQRS